jgi:retinol dehydrogenase-16
MAPMNWVLVTGCDSGFGSIVVEMLIARRFGVFATHLIPESANTLRAKSEWIVPLLTDITKQESVDAMATKIRETLASYSADQAQLYGLVNNAGLLFQSGPVEWTPAANFEKMFAVNCVGAVRVTNSVLPLLRKSKGRIVNVASIAGRIGIPSQSAYCASKHAMEAYSDCLRRELMDWGVTVHIIEPGVFSKTGLYSTYHDGVQKLWEGIDKTVQEDYGEDFKKQFGDRCSKGLNQYGSHDSTLVPKAMIEALTSPRPLYRYQVGPDAKFLVPLFKYFSEAVQDATLMFEGPIFAKAMDRSAGKTALKKYYRPKVFRKIAILVFLMWLLKKV